ncbi:ankyrin repeat protein [Colletotrichum incanum]|uniref:Ankyrin repeat protein n=1 Tax=Colletotrichum incanum TaxID=1573173 RepID=A0A167E4J9_COLIC|nr:ankyrin repeat protein [Colletotrichum incanum]
MAMLDDTHPDLPKAPNDHNAYTLGSVGEHNIVIACLPKGQYGTASAATVATRMIMTFPAIKFGLMIGIGGGIPVKVRLGDVVVGTPTGQFPGVVQWDLGKATDGGGFQRTGALNNPPAVLVSALQKLESRHELHGSKVNEYLEEMVRRYPRLKSKYARSAALEDVLFKSEYAHVDRTPTGSLGTAFEDVEEDEEEEEDEREGGCLHCDRTKTRKRKPRTHMKVHYGLIASGNQVIKDAVRRDKLNKDLGGNVLCVEMEAAGLVNNFPCLVIRGICDYADSHKNKAWQEHAAAVAAAFARELLGYVQPRDVDEECSVLEQIPELQRKVQEIHSATSAIGDDVRHLGTLAQSAADQEILDWLTPIDYGSQQSDTLRRRQKGTCEWFLASEEYRLWLETPGQTLFCPGMPRAGKTVLTSAVVDNLTTRYSADLSIGVAYVYFNFRQQSTQQLEDMLSSLLKQLAWAQCILPKSIRDLHTNHNRSRTRPSETEISQALSEVSKSFSRVFFVVDAVDECQADGCRPKFLSTLFNLIRSHSVRANVFATSRFMSDIERKFEGSIRREIKAVDQDVCRYIQQYLPEIFTRITPLPGLEVEITNGIVSAVSGMFLLAQLYLASLKDTTSVAEVRTVLKGFKIQQSVRNGVENAMERAYDQAYDEAMIRLNGQTPKLRDLGRRMEDPYFDCDNIREVNVILSVCAGLVTVDQDSNIIRLVHYTAQEFFQRKNAQGNLDDHCHMTETCIEYLRFALDRCSLPASPSQFASSELAQTYPLTSYAHYNWGYHASKATTLSQRVIDFLLNYEKPTELHKSLRFGNITTPTTPLEWAAYHGILKAIDWFHKGELITNVGVSFSISKALHWAIRQGQVESVECLLGLGTTLTQNETKETPLHLAAYRGNIAVIAMLLAHGADINATNSSGWSPLDIASKQGDLDVIKFLLEKGASVSVDTTYNSSPAVMAMLIEYGVDIDAVNSSGKRPLEIALERGDLGRVKTLLQKGASIDAADTYGRTPIEIAARKHDLASADLLLEKGAVCTLGLSEFPPLNEVVSDGCFKLMKYLIDNGADVNLRTNAKTPLHYETERHVNRRADLSGLGAVVSFLIEKGADIEAKDEDGRTPLAVACKFGHDTTVRLLIERGADIETKDNNGMTPLANACFLGHDAAVSLLIEKGADIEVKDEDGRTPLVIACKFRRDTAVSLLVEKGADIEAKDEDGRTPLVIACFLEYDAAARLLIEKGADIEAKDEDGRTPLAIACMSGYGEVAVVSLLVEKGADIEAKDEDGRTPLTIARKCGQDDLAKILREAVVDRT